MRVAAALIACSVATASAADRPVRRPLNRDERDTVLALMKAVDLAQDTEVLSPLDIGWGSHVLKSIDLGYVPFRVRLDALPELPKSAAMYVRVVSRHDGYRSTEEDSAIREWVLKGTPLPMRQQEAV